MRRFWKLPLVCSTVATLVSANFEVQAVEKRLVTVDDQFAFHQVSDPHISPNGNWIAYTVEDVDLKNDTKDYHIYMTSWDGSRTLRTTTGKDSGHSPRFSPDGKYLAFLSSRQYNGQGDQIWLMNLTSGQPKRISNINGGVSDFVWSPDGKRLAVVASDPDPKTSGQKKTPPPIVIDRFQFKEDGVGYLGKKRDHLYVLDLATSKVNILTRGEFNEYLPSWSPDSKRIAFVSKRGADFDRHNKWNVYIMEAKPGAKPRQLTTFDGPNCDPSWGSRPVWSPDGKLIAYLQGGPEKLIEYAVYHLAVIPAAGGTPRLLSGTLDRNVVKPHFTNDGASILFLLEDDGVVHLAKVPVAGGKVERVVGGRRTVSAFDLGRDGRIAVLSSTPQEPNEVFALKGTSVRPLSHVNQDLLAKLKLGKTEEISFTSLDGTQIHGFMVKPPNFQVGKKYPTLLRIHGGPVGQYVNQFMFEWQVFAAHGYVVVAANPRGSVGRGEVFSKAIYADWGNKDAQDILAAVDYVVSLGIGDPSRLGIGGWSYGGILTNYTIAQDTRFKAAISGAGASNILAGYGTDAYVRDYEQELGVPWKNLDTWLRLSFPFLHADRIVTPTLFLCGELDAEVPLLNSEQMYQALKSLKIDTQLIIYPRQFHTLSKPSYQRDTLLRYLAWYDKYLMSKTATHSS
ncbi:MAG: S9 family peptidase [Stigonema ocellatum SAG 48.90 = DSM 106950]|nr:S9 family peptidase [Stigonema ocellatum SAG 48.90 = DSM 106950]